MKKSHISLSRKLSRCNTIITGNHNTNILKLLILFVCSQWNVPILLRDTFNLSYRAHLFFLIFRSFVFNAFPLAVNRYRCS